MITLYRINRSSDEITAIIYERVTEHFAVRNNGQRDSLSNSYDSLHTTRAEAVETKREQLRMAVTSAKARLKLAEHDLAVFDSKQAISTD